MDLCKKCCWFYNIIGFIIFYVVRLDKLLMHGNVISTHKFVVHRVYTVR